MPGGAEPDGPTPGIIVDRPGRWVGGAIGAAASLGAALVAGLAVSRAPIDGPTSFATGWFQIGLLGIPIGFALGRQLLPTARSGGWTTALGTGIALGLAAPPLGALEILLGWGFVPTNGVGSPPGFATLILLPFAIPISFAAVVMTIPVGIAWGIVVRLVPSALLERSAAPAWLGGFGIRHALILAVAFLIAGPLARAIVTP